jgi:hypothetical protein
LRTRVEQAISARIDQELWSRADEIEAAERESLTAYIAGMPSNFRQVRNCRGEGGAS